MPLDVRVAALIGGFELLAGLLFALGRMLDPLLLWFEAWLTGLINRNGRGGPEVSPPVTGGAGNNPLGNIPRWPFDPLLVDPHAGGHHTFCRHR